VGDKNKMAKVKQKPITTPTGEWVYCTLRVRPEEMAKWREVAAIDDRSLSYWARTELNKAAAAALGKEVSNENLSVETVPADRPASDVDRG
jgi:hypothetical protein